MHKRIKQTWTHKKPVRRNTFLQGTEILQIFKKKKKKKQKQSKPQTPQQTIGVTVTRTWGTSRSSWISLFDTSEKFRKMISEVNLKPKCCLQKWFNFESFDLNNYQAANTFEKFKILLELFCKQKEWRFLI